MSDDTAFRQCINQPEADPGDKKGSPTCRENPLTPRHNIDTFTILERVARPSGTPAKHPDPQSRVLGFHLFYRIVLLFHP